MIDGVSRRHGWPELNWASLRTMPPAVAVVAAMCFAAAATGVLAGVSPKYAIEAVLAFAFIPLAVKRFTLATAIFVVSTFLGLPGSVQKGIGFILIIVALGSLASSRHSMPNFFADHKRMTALLFGFLAWAVLGVIWATSAGTVISSVSRYLPNLLVYFVLYAATRDRRDARLLVASFALGSAVAAGAAIVLPARSYVGVARAGGFFGDPNELAAALVAGLALSAAFSRGRSMTRLGRAVAAVAGAVCLIGILLTVSRGGLIALGVALVAGSCLAGRWRPWLLLATSIIAVAVVGYFATVAPQSARDRLSASADNSSGRSTIWKIGWREVQHNPITGVGAGNFPVAGTQYLNEPGALLDFAPDYQGLFLDRPTVAHNTYLETLAEEGIPGFLMFMLLVVASLDCARRAASRFRASGDEEMELLSYALLCGTLGFLAASFFLTEIFSKQLYLLLALGPVLLAASKFRNDRVAPRRGRAT